MREYFVAGLVAVMLLVSFSQTLQLNALEEKIEEKGIGQSQFASQPVLEQPQQPAQQLTMVGGC